MIDKKTLTLIISGGIVGLLIIVGLIIWLVLANQKSDTDPMAQPQDSSEVQDEKPAIEFTEEQQQTVFDVAVAASAWRGSADPEGTRLNYQIAGMSDALARDYTPVWAGYFGDNVTAQVFTKLATSNLASIEYEEGSVEHGGKFRVGVKIGYEGTFHDMQKGQTLPVGPSAAVWYITLDERSGQVIAIEQPPLADLGLPAPELPKTDE